MQRVFHVIFFIKIQYFQMVANCLGIGFVKSHAGETLQDAVDFLQKYRGVRV
jgi:hypothetical protein